SDWLSTDALLFEFLFIDKAGEALDDERKLIELVLREQIANGTVRIDRCASGDALAEHCARVARRSLCHCLLVSTEKHSFQAEDTVASQLHIDGATPRVEVSGELPEEIETDGLLESWGSVLERLLQLWV